MKVTFEEIIAKSFPEIKSGIIRLKSEPSCPKEARLKISPHLGIIFVVKLQIINEH